MNTVGIIPLFQHYKPFQTKQSNSLIVDKKVPDKRIMNCTHVFIALQCLKEP